MMDIYGRCRFGHIERDQIDHMASPVRCAHCGDIYDLRAVEVTARYTDCSVWQTPCCRRTVDDRGETGWMTRRDYTRIDQEGGKS